MTSKPKPVSLYYAKSYQSSEVNKTGSWRFVRPFFQEKKGPCSTICPAGEDIPKIENLVVRGEFNQAWQKILLENPFPAVCGRVCFHTCESACNRTFYDEPIAIHQIERFLGDFALSNDLSYQGNRRRANGLKIAIIGAGPSGLAAAWFLKLLGFDCDVFEKENAPGGILRWGIPDYRLPKTVLNDEIHRLRQLGITIKTNTHVDEAFLKSLYNEYNGIYIGCGHGRPYTLKVPGENLAHDGLEFLKKIQTRLDMDIQGDCAVIGGGNTAIDVARSLIRLGANPVIVYRRRIEDMPAHSDEILKAQSEGVGIKPLFSPIALETYSGGIKLTLNHMKVDGETDDGRARVVPTEGQNQTIHFTQVFTAIGAGPASLWHDSTNKIFNSIKRIKAFSHSTLQDDDQPVIFGGDLTNSIYSVADAIASGKQAAIMFDLIQQKKVQVIEDELVKYRLPGTSAMSMENYLAENAFKHDLPVVDFKHIQIDYFPSEKRKTPLLLSFKNTSDPFEPLEQTFVIQDAIKEASRCFQCGHCNHCDNCRIYCPELAVCQEQEKRSINYDYCKGCGICVVECPRNAMALEDESS